jgi:hypothetical protein
MRPGEAVPRTWFGRTALYDAYELAYMATLARLMGEAKHRQGCTSSKARFDLDCPVCALLNEGTFVHAVKILLGGSLRDPSVFGFLPSEDASAPGTCATGGGSRP